MKAFTLLLPLVSAVYVSAHGILVGMTVNGAPQNRNVIRSVRNQDPNRGANNPALLCGPDAQVAPASAKVMPGDTLGFDWKSPNFDNWPHNTGPELTYLASCGDVTCDKFNAANAKWFKIAERSKKSNGQWFQADMMNGALATAKLPDNLAAGNYLIRHEIIALHLANAPQGAEFYPGCAQLIVGGTQTGRPQGELVTFPGAYKDTDPGILGNFFGGGEYKFPGPKIATLSSSGAAPAPAPAASATSSGSPAPPASTSGAPKPSTPTQGAPSAGATGKNGKSCKLKKQYKRSPVDADTLAADNEVPVARRHLSRVMRRLAFTETH
jgi:hypothetical protein